LLTPGQRIFEYEVIRPLGQGGFATVFEAVDRMLNRRVAIKQLLVDKVNNEKNIKRFIQEARVMATLEHPNVVTMHGLRVADQQLYMIMEYLAGGSLRALLKEKGRLPVEQAVRMVVGICEGLAKLHDKGIIHRDIKVDNILLTTDGRPKITDFGIAHVPESAGGLNLTKVGFQPSTLFYSSPEQFRGEKLDPRSDVYQVGELLYHMLTGQHYIDLTTLEIEASSQVELKLRPELKLYALIERAIIKDMPAGLQDLWQEYGVLAGIVERAMAKQKEDRFADTLELAAALSAININTTPIFIKAEKLDLQDSRAYNKRGLAHASMRNYEQAIRDYTKAIQLDRHYSEAYNNRSAAHLMMENYTQAVLDCNWSLELTPHFIAALVNRGIAYTGLRNYEEALHDYNKVIELNSKNIYAYYNRGNTYIWMGNYEDALMDYTQVISLNPEFLAAYVNRGVVYDQLEDWELALADYDQAIKLNPVYGYAYYNRARAYYALGNYEQAVADYSKVIELNPHHPHAHENRAKVYQALGDTDRAAEDQAKTLIRMPSLKLNPKQLSVARSLLMPATPLDFLTRK
jgi:serine/threonine protein kinase